MPTDRSLTFLLNGDKIEMRFQNCTFNFCGVREFQALAEFLNAGSDSAHDLHVFMTAISELLQKFENDHLVTVYF
jgi:hypothetical protein